MCIVHNDNCLILSLQDEKGFLARVNEIYQNKMINHTRKNRRGKINKNAEFMAKTSVLRVNIIYFRQNVQKGEKIEPIRFEFFVNLLALFKEL